VTLSVAAVSSTLAYIHRLTGCISAVVHGVAQDYVVSMSTEAAQMSSFVLSEPRPGAAPLDPAATIEAAGVANAMLVLKSS